MVLRRALPAVLIISVIIWASAVGLFMQSGAYKLNRPYLA